MQGKCLEADGLDPKVIYFLVNIVGACAHTHGRESIKKTKYFPYKCQKGMINLLNWMILFLIG